MRSCPAGADDIVEALAKIDHAGRAIALVPGLSTENDGMPDVMRGEETQILGALEIAKTEGGVFLLPGTHSKWAGVTQGRITSFRTFMTGEVFGALKDHTILGRLMREGAPDAESFARGVREGAALGSAGALLNRIFATRTYGLMDQLADTALATISVVCWSAPKSRRQPGRSRAAVTIIAESRAGAALHRCVAPARTPKRARAGRLRRGRPLAHCARRRL